MIDEAPFSSAAVTATVSLVSARLGPASGTDEWSVVGRRLDEAQSSVWLAKLNAGDELPTNEHVLAQAARRFATRYEKTLRNYAAVVALGCAFLWLRII